MIKSNCFATFLSLLLVATQVTGLALAEDNLPPPEDTTAGEDTAEEEVADTSNGHAEFADELTTHLYSTPPPDRENDCTSSLGVSMALSLVYPSAISDSEVQMRTTLGYPEDSQSVLLWQNTTTALTDRYQGRCYNYNQFLKECGGQEPLLEIANSVFVDANLTLNATYEAVVGDLLQQLDFGSEQAGGMVNQWVNETTNGLIPSIVKEGKLEPWIMLAINSIYLKASWIEQFNEYHTNQDLFYYTTTTTTTSTTTVTNNITNTTSTTKDLVVNNLNSTAHFMHKVDYFPYSHDALPGYQVLQLGFAGDYTADSTGLSMIFVLPLMSDNETSASFAPSELASSVDVVETIPQLRRTRVAVALPKFRFEASYQNDLKAALQTMNMTAPFEAGRRENLCIIQGRCDALIDTIIQKTYIDLNEKGVEAAAVTAIGIALTSAIIYQNDPILFQADRPFQFFLFDSREELVIFEGQVRNPGIPPGSVVTNTNLDQHADGTFYQTTFGARVVLPPPAPAAPDAPATPEITPEADEMTTETTTTTTTTTTATTATSKTVEDSTQATAAAAAAKIPQEAPAPDTETDMDATITSAAASNKFRVVSWIAAGFLLVVSSL